MIIIIITITLIVDRAGEPFRPSTRRTRGPRRGRSMALGLSAARPGRLQAPLIERRLQAALKKGRLQAPLIERRLQAALTKGGCKRPFASGA